MGSQTVAFEREHQLCVDLSINQGRLVTSNAKGYLPGHPLVPLEDGEIIPFIEKELLTPSLNQMSPWLWLLAVPKSTHVCALHMQIVRGRSIIVTEDPEMHAVWINNRVFVKPLPPYLLSHAFWSYLVYPPNKLSDFDQTRRAQLVQASLGYIRTYVYLIKHESDLRIAQREGLVPNSLNLETWAAFIRDFQYIEDHQVSGRYHYGELRLTRLNFWAKPLLRRWHFRKATWQYAEHFARYFAPLLFIFGLWSLILDSMQVGLQARPNWQRFGNVSAWFSVATLVSVVAVAAFLLGAFGMMAGREMWYACGKQIRKRRRRRRARAAQSLKTGAD
ncbi:hypothetical protein H2200_005377 [Cladophialophora chaetospira]|uniref:Subtilisin-like serine protease n=1 Tax=Cladophialophora chaetospira TaxID=386627 RepID=A0AA38XBV5_9EURO|nr:hypothetical protein H2200_005377 [Cladophialophora chaetospira]